MGFRAGVWSLRKLCRHVMPAIVVLPMASSVALARAVAALRQVGDRELAGRQDAKRPTGTRSRRR